MTARAPQSLGRLFLLALAAAGLEGSPALAYLEQPTSGTAANSGSIRLLFHLNENSGITASDAGRYANDGTLTNFPAIPWTGTALTFDGVDDYVSVPDASSLDLTTGLTLEAWVNTGALGVAGKWTVLSKWDEVDGRRSYLLRIDRLSGNVEFLLSSDGTASLGSLFTLTSSAALTANTFAHLSATYDGTTMKIFIDGDQDLNTLAGPVSVFSSPAPVRIGARGDATQAPSDFFQGTIDEPRVLEYARQDFAQRTLHHFNESGTTPPAGNGGFNNAAQLVNGPTYTSTGARFGNALSFDGIDSYAEAIYVSPDAELTGLTLEAWITPNTVTGMQAIIAKESSGNTNYRLQLNGANVEMILKTAATTTLTSSGTVVAGALTHVAGTWDGSTMRIFINGLQDPSTAVKTGNLSNVNKAVRIGGGAGNTPDSPFNGTIDEARLLSNARTGFNPGPVVNEVALSPPAGNQWIELYNGGGATVNLAGWVFTNTSDSSTYTVPSTGTRTIAPGAFVVIELGSGVDTASTYFTANDPGNTLVSGDLSSSSDTLSVYPNSTISSANIIDYVAWGAAPPAGADGLAAGLWARQTFVGVAPTAQSVGLLADGNNEEGWKDWGGLTPASKGSSNVGATAAGVTGFRARIGGKGVDLSWETVLEPNHLGFNLYRAAEEEGPYTRINGGLILGSIGSPFGARYAFRDPDGRGGDWYVVEDIDAAGRPARHPAVRASDAAAEVGEGGAWERQAASAVSPTNPRPATLPPRPLLPARSGRVSHLNLAVGETGIHRVGWDRLVPLTGLAGGSMENLILTDGGTPVPFRVRPSTRRGGEPVLEFFGTAAGGKYSPEHVYQLRPERGALRSRPMAARSGRVSSGATPAEVFTGVNRFEENRLYFVSSTEEDLFFWDVVFNQQGPVSLPFESDALPGPALLRGDLLGVTEAPSIPRNHHVRIRLNGTPVYEGFFKDTDSHRFEAALPPGALLPANVLEIEAVGDGGSPFDVFLVNWFEVEAPRRLLARGDHLLFEADASLPVRLSGFSRPGIEIFDVTDVRAPVEIVRFTVSREADGRFAAVFQDPGGPEGLRRYLAVGEGGFVQPSLSLPPGEKNLRDRSNRGDYLVLTTPELRTALEPLLDLRRREGFETRVVDVQAVYDQFGAGNKNPEAIRDFVAEAAKSWRVPPRYLLLAGGASFDPRGYLGTGRADRVPTRLFFTRKYHYEAADDGYFTSALPRGSPPMAVGRLPAQSAEEMAAAVGKIVEYETTQAGRPQGRALFVADDRNARSGLPDPTFEATSDALAEGLSGAGVAIRRLSLRSAQNPREALGSALAEGVDLVNFLGHGGPQAWTSAGLLRTEDASSLPNGRGSYFTVFSLTCFDGIFTFAYGDSLAWSLVKAAGRGAVAAYSPSTILDPGPHADLDRLLLEGAYRGGPMRLGDLVQQVESALNASGPAYLDMVDSYNLIGDPALRLGWSDR